MKIINSVVVVGLYYGFLTTFSIGALLSLPSPSSGYGRRRRRNREERSATTTTIAGQLMMFISIYYAPLHLALGRPHTITVLALPYLFFHFFSGTITNTFFDYGSTTRNEMRNLRIQCFCWLVNWSHFIHEMVWIQQNNSIRSNVLIRSNKYKFLVSELRNSMTRIFSRIPSPIFFKKLKRNLRNGWD
uniref:Translocon at the inner envelope membrane of chloroplasts 214 n=1 Tax=Brassica campestris TaxID=3711 RepID=A0A3P6D186_BRACM|nr:unnamed protein product [Brassica rapa]